MHGGFILELFAARVFVKLHNIIIVPMHQIKVSSKALTLYRLSLALTVCTIKMQSPCASQWLNKKNHRKKSTRMVQLPATAAIEYVAACLRGGTFVRGAYARSAPPPKFNAYTNRLGFLCLAS